MSACGCDATPPGKSLKTIEEALEFILAQVKPVTETETLPLTECLGRVLAKSLTSQINVPPWDNSAMDGYVVRLDDLTAPGVVLPVAQRIPAGSVGSELRPGTAARIFTGSPIPAGADTVVIQEACERVDDGVRINEIPKRGANIRSAGEDIKQGEEIVTLGVRLAPQHLGLAASVGVGALTVYRRLRVAVFASGSELVMPGEPLAPGKIYNSNQYTLQGLLTVLGCEVIQLGVVEDTLDATREALAKGAEQADLVLASGGVSVGEEDHVKPAVEQLGSLDLWKVAIRPGKPLAFGHIGDTPFIGSPGNPVSLFVTFCIFARPYILKAQGVDDVAPRPINAIAGFDWSRAEKRREYARARLDLDHQGKPVVTLYPSRSSGVLSSVTWANGLAIIPEGQTLKQGDKVQFLPFTELSG